MIIIKSGQYYLKSREGAVIAEGHVGWLEDRTLAMFCFLIWGKSENLKTTKAPHSVPLGGSNFEIVSISLVLLNIATVKREAFKNGNRLLF